MSGHDPAITAAISRLMVAKRHSNGGGCGDPVLVAEARRELAAAKLAKVVRETVAAAPLTDAQADHIIALLRGGADDA